VAEGYDALGWNNRIRGAILFSVWRVTVRMSYSVCRFSQ